MKRLFKVKHFFGNLLKSPVAPNTYKRWKLIPPTFAIHMSIGSMYSWSMFNSPLSNMLGVVAPSADDWKLSSIVPIFSVVAFFHGISAWLLADWQSKVGFRRSLAYGAFAYGGGMITTGIAANYHSLPIMYLGYGLISGIGLGLSYVPPMENLIKWYPNKTGFATGITICGFGGGTILAAPVIQKLINVYKKPPEYLGSVKDVIVDIKSNGRMYSNVMGETREVVIANESTLSQFKDINEGVYVVGTGSTGVAMTLSTLGCFYLMTILYSAFCLKKIPDGYKVLKTETNKSNFPAPLNILSMLKSPFFKLITLILPKKKTMGDIESSLDIKTVTKTSQFYLIWGTFASFATAGMSFAGTANNMISEVFGNTLPDIVTPSFAMAYVATFSLFNLAGRLVWPNFSDTFGRKNTFYVFTFLGVPLLMIMPLSLIYLTQTSPYLTLTVFYVSSMLIVSFFGGTYATVPAYATELFGRKSIGKVHGRLLTASSFAAICGPNIVIKLRRKAELDSIYDLVSKCDQKLFNEKFGMGIENVSKLIETKTLTISRLMEIMPEGTIDPTPCLYNSTMFTMCGVFLIGGVANKLIKKVSPEIYRKKIVDSSFNK